MLKAKKEEINMMWSTILDENGLADSFGLAFLMMPPRTLEDACLRNFDYFCIQRKRNDDHDAVYMTNFGNGVEISSRDPEILKNNIEQKFLMECMVNAKLILESLEVDTHQWKFTYDFDMMDEGQPSTKNFDSSAYQIIVENKKNNDIKIGYNGQTWNLLDIDDIIDEDDLFETIDDATLSSQNILDVIRFADEFIQKRASVISDETRENNF